MLSLAEPLLASQGGQSKLSLKSLGQLNRDDIDIDIFVNCRWVDTRWRYTFTHKQYIEHNS
jgi:hypothetical protein